MLPRPRLCCDRSHIGDNAAMHSTKCAPHLGAAIQRRTDALICMLGNGAAPLFPHLAPPHPLMGTLRDFTSFFSTVFSSQFSGFLISRSSPSLYGLFPRPSPPPPTSSCLRQMPRLSASQGSLRCRLPRLSATLSSFLLLPLFQSALPVLQPSRFQRCFKNQAD